VIDITLREPLLQVDLEEGTHSDEQNGHLPQDQRRRVGGAQIWGRLIGAIATKGFLITEALVEGGGRGLFRDNR
jgi:hypothetical protein